MTLEANGCTRITDVSGLVTVTKTVNVELTGTSNRSISRKRPPMLKFRATNRRIGFSREVR
jgi:hypothetical protein